MAAVLSFWTRVWRRKIQPQLESFVSDLAGYTLIFLGLIYVYLFFWFLRRIGIPEWLVAFMESSDHAGIAITFSAFVDAAGRGVHACRSPAGFQQAGYCNAECR